MAMHCEDIFGRAYLAGTRWARLHGGKQGQPTRQDMRNYAVPALRAYDAADVLTLLPTYIQGFQAGVADEFSQIPTYTVFIDATSD